MSTGPNDAAEIEVTCKVGDLRVTICGPGDQATDLLRDISRLAGRAGSPGGSTDFEVVGAPSTSRAASSPGGEHRSEIEATFDECPVHLVLSGSRLSGSALSGADRIRRAWRAGQWAKAVKDGRIPTPSRTPQLDLRPRFYAVLRAEGLSTPVIYKSAKAYWNCVGDLATSSAISHGFPSEAEARAFFAGAGAPHPELVP